MENAIPQKVAMRKAVARPTIAQRGKRLVGRVRLAQFFMTRVKSAKEVFVVKLIVVRRPRIFPVKRGTKIVTTNARLEKF